VNGMNFGEIVISVCARLVLFALGGGGNYNINMNNVYYS